MEARQQMEPTVYVHVGHGRCGSSSIQVFAENQRDALHSHGVLYPSALDMGFSADEARAGNGRGLVVSEDSVAAVARVAAHLAGNPAPRALLSAEQFMSAESALLQRLVAALRAEGMRVVAIAYLREQREWLVSRWAQGLKSHGWSMTLDDYLAEHMQRYSLDYRPLCARLARIFGHDGLVLRRFQRDALHGGDVRVDLFDVVGVDVADLINDAPTTNASASIEEAVALRLLNTLAPSPIYEPRPFLRYAQSLAEQEGWPRDRGLHRLASPERMQAIAAHYAPLNDKLRGAFPPDTPDPLFISTVPDDYERTPEDDCVTARSLTLVAGFLTYYGKRRLRKATRARASAGTGSRGGAAAT